MLLPTIFRPAAAVSVAAGLTVLAALPVSAPEAPPPGEARNLILMIADGAGTAHWTLARRARKDALAVASMPVVGLVDSRNVDGRITDSAASATAYATGRRSFNRGISLTPECRGEAGAGTIGAGSWGAGPGNGCAPLETIVETAERRGRASGLVTTTALTDATPAAFAAHVHSRYMHEEIAAQMLSSGVDVLLGGGRASFATAESGGGDMLAEACARADCPETGAALRSLDPSARPLLGLFAPGDLPRAGHRDPDLPTLTTAALGRLSHHSGGFFLLIETEGTDTYSHDNEDVASITAEIDEFDRAVEIALAFARSNSGTLVVVTADHETGGLAVQEEGGETVLRYTTGGHTAALVPLFAEGPGAERLAGIRDNDEVGRILRELFLGR